MNNENELWYPLRRNSFEYALSPILSKEEQKPAPEAAKPAPAPVPAPAPAVTPEEKLPALDDPAPAKEHRAASFHTASMQEEATEMPKRPAAPARPMPAPAPSVMKKPELNSEAPASVQQTSGSAEKKRNMRLAVLALCIVIATTAAVVCVSKFGKRLPKAEESVSDSRKDEDEEKDTPEDSHPDAPESATDAPPGQDSAAETAPPKETGIAPETQYSTEAVSDPSDPTDPQGGTETQEATEAETQLENSESSKVMFRNLRNQEFVMIEDMMDGTFQLYYSSGDSAGEVENQENSMGSYTKTEQNAYRHDYTYTESGRDYHKVDLANDIIQKLLVENNTNDFGNYEEEPRAVYQFTDTEGNVYLGRQIASFNRKDIKKAEESAMFDNWGCADIMTDSNNNSGFILDMVDGSGHWEYRDMIISNGPDYSDPVKHSGTYEMIGTQLYIFRYEGNEVFRLWCEDNGEVFLLEYQKQ